MRLRGRRQGVGGLVLSLPGAPQVQFTYMPAGPVPAPHPTSTHPYGTLPTPRSQVYLRPAKQEQWPRVGREGTWAPGPPEPDTPPSHGSEESLPSRLHIPIPWTRGLDKIFFESPATMHPSRPPASGSLAGEASNPLLASGRVEQQLTWRERPAWLGVTP